MKLTEVVVDFPDQSRKVRRDRSRERDKTHDPVTGLKWPEGHADAVAQDEFMIIDQDGKAHAMFDDQKTAQKAIKRLELKSGMRGLYVQKI